MIRLTPDERDKLLRLFPDATIQSTKHRAYVVATEDTIAAICQIRHEKPPVRLRPFYWHDWRGVLEKRSDAAKPRHSGAKY